MFFYRRHQKAITEGLVRVLCLQLGLDWEVSFLALCLSLCCSLTEQSLKTFVLGLLEIPWKLYMTNEVDKWHVFKFLLWMERFQRLIHLKFKVLISQEILVRFDLHISLPFFPCNGNYLMLITDLLRLGSHTFAGHLPVHNRRDHFTQFFCLCPHCWECSTAA